MERHDTHALSSYSSSSCNHSYNSNYKINKNNHHGKHISDDLNNKIHISKIQIKKIDSIINKYEINNSDQPQNNKNSKKSIQKNENQKEDEINIGNIKNMKDNKNLGDNKSIYKDKNNNIDDIYNVNYIGNINSYLKKNNDLLEIKKKDKKDEELNIIKNNRNTEMEKNKNDILVYSLSYKAKIKENKFSKIKKSNNNDNENNKKLKLKQNKLKLLTYLQVYKSGNLLRGEIKKPGICFITKIFKNSYENDQNLFLTVKNKYCFCTKISLPNKKYIKKIKILKSHKKNEDEQIPTFSSINTSSSKIVSKSKSKSKHKSKSKPNLRSLKSKDKMKLKRKSNLYYPININKNKKVHQSLSMYSKNPKIKNDKEEKKESKKNKNKKNQHLKNKSLYIPKKKSFEVDKNFRNSMIENKTNSKANFIYNKNENVKTSNNNIKEKEKEKEKENSFKKFLEKQKNRRNKKLSIYMKRKGINSYNLFYPKEPSPLLGTFKNKYNIYPKLNQERKNSIEIGTNNRIIINNKKYYKIKNHYKKDNLTQKDDNQNYHLIERHYGLEKDCPICRAFQMRKMNNYPYITNTKSMNYQNLDLGSSRMTQHSFSFINLIGNDTFYLSKNAKRNNSALNINYLEDYPKIRRKTFINEYFKN